MESSSQIHYIALQSRIQAFQTAIHQFLQVFTKSPSYFDDECGRLVSKHLEHNYHVLLSECQTYSNQLQFYEQTSTIPDNPIAPHLPLSFTAPITTHISPIDHAQYDINYANFGLVQPDLDEEGCCFENLIDSAGCYDLELEACLELLSQEIIPNPNTGNSSISNTMVASPQEELPCIAEEQRAAMVALAAIFNLQFTSLSMPRMYSGTAQPENIVIPLPQLNVGKAAMLNGWILVKNIIVMTMQCDHLVQTLRDLPRVMGTTVSHSPSGHHQ